VDPFAGGRLLTERLLFEGARALGGKLEWRDEFLRRSRTDEIFERVLSNLAVGFEQKRTAWAATAPRCLAALPRVPEKQLKAASLADELGAHDVAHRIYEHLVDTFPETPECETAFERLEQGSRGLAIN
jgi:regulator of sirC expression with transglutaminase-like and TPR domain